MRHRQFLFFILPSALVVLLLIAVPILSVAYQSLFIAHEQVMKSVENCGPFGCQREMHVDTEAMAMLKAAAPMGQFNGLGTYTNASHLALDEVKTIWHNRTSLGAAVRQTLNLPFYKALGFTLAYTGVVTPLVILAGFIIALAVNTLPSRLRGPVIFISLLPMIVTPLIGAMVVFWMIDSRGIIGANLQLLFNDPTLSLKASATLTWLTLFVYGVWHSTPFSFIIFYAALQTVPESILESSHIDGTNRWQRIRYVVIPHLAPVAIFIALMQLMDNFRVFEPIVGLSAEANATSLSYLIYNDLRNSDTPLFGSAAATSVLTILGVIVLLMPMLVRTWHDFTRKY